MKPTNINIAKYYNLTVQTLSNYKSGSVEKQRVYLALKKYFIEQNCDKTIIT